MLSNRWLVLTLLFAVRTGMGIQYQAVAALSPLYMEDFALSIADIGFLIGLYHAPGALLAFPGGAIAARLGDKRVVIMGLALMVAGELMMAMALGWSMQVAGRFVAGGGGILLSVSISKMVTDWFAGKEIATAMAIIGNAAPFGIAIALLALPTIAEMGGRMLVSGGIIAYAIAAMACLTLGYRPATQAKAVQAAGSLWPAWNTVQAVVAAGVVYGLYNAALVSVIGFGPLMLIERGWTITTANSITSVVLWLCALSLPAGGWLADWTQRSGLVLATGLAGFAGALIIAARVDIVLPAFISLGILSGVACGPIMALPSQVLTPNTRAVGMGIFYTVYYALQIACPSLVGAIADMFGHSYVALDIGAAFLLVGALAWMLFRRISNGAVAPQSAI
ncbi:MAG TPA: MFS transporter [Alphaproteobacteria bacterium]|nr:MFS transporter [Alphaproteobacteria bacterium]